MTIGLLASIGDTSPARAEGSPLVRTFGVDETQGGYQIFGAAEDSRGLLYFADATSGISEYDGERWRTIEAPSQLLALAVGANDRLWVGSHQDIGFFEGDEIGAWRYTSLRDRLPPGQDQFSDVWPIVAWGEEVFFVAREHLYRFANGRMTAWSGDDERIFYRAYEADGRRFFAQLGVGLVELVGEALLPLRALSPIADAEINGFFSLGAGRFLVLTRRRGAYLWDGGGEPSSLVPQERGDVDWLLEHGVQHATRVDEDRIAIGSVIGGIGVFDEELNLLQTIDRSTGLDADLIHVVTTDREGHLWAGTDHGIAHVRLDPGLAFYGEATGLEGAPRFLLPETDGYVVGTSLGLWRLRKGAKRRATVEHVPGFDTPSWSALPWDDETLLVSDANGVVALRQSRGDGLSLSFAERISDERTHQLFRAQALPGELLAARETGVGRLVESGGQWRSLGRLAGIDQPIDELLDGPDDSSIALAGTRNRLFVMRPAKDGSPSMVSVRGPAGSLALEIRSVDLEETSYLLEIDDAVHLVSEAGVVRATGFDAEGTLLLERDEELSALLEGESDSWWPTTQDARGRVWLVSDSARELAIAERRDGLYQRRVMARELPRVVFVVPDPEIEETVWVGTYEGLFSIDASAPRRAASAFRAQVRRVENGSGRLLFGGQETFTGPAIFEADDRDVRIEFAAPGFGVGSGLLYRHRLDGFDDGWSPWRERPDREYTNLPAGEYTFRVEARDLWGEISAEDRFTLRIEPPWYATPWAWIGWASMVLGLVALVVRVRSAALRRHNQVLRMRVEERTVSLAEQTLRSEEQALRLQRAKEQLEEENRHRHVLEEEKARLLSRSERSQRLESLGMMAGGIAHDFNNILMAVLGNADLCLVNQELDADTRQRLGAISQAAQRAADLCSQMLSFAGKGTLPQLEPVDCNAIVRETLGLARASVPVRVHYETRLEENLPPVQGDSVKLHQVLLNLLLNAAESYGEDGGEVLVETSLFQHSGEDLQNMVLAETLPAGLYVCCVVSDHGSGIAQAIEHRIFEPFFTTKFAGRGLGLAASLGIVKAHGGALRLETAPGEGTRFEVVLPVSVGEQKRVETRDTALEPLIEGRILVVDDEPLVREVAGLMLRTLGSDPVEAASSGAALDVFDTDGPFDLAILDYSLPDFDGFELAHRLRERAPHLPIVLASGWSDETIVERATHHDAIDAFLHKPYKIDALARALRGAAVSAERTSRRRQATAADSRDLLDLPIDSSEEPPDDSSVDPSDGQAAT